ncbi:MAG: hypothetical protein MZV65_25580 [Chromatiales bacterium]|nr:hypothetical protein [Chromatiales bacterium]
MIGPGHPPAAHPVVRAAARGTVEAAMSAAGAAVALKSAGFPPDRPNV